MHHWSKSYFDWTPFGICIPLWRRTAPFKWLHIWATYIKWNNRKMGFANMGVRTLWGAMHKQRLCIISAIKKWDHLSPFLQSNKNILIRLHSSALVCTRLVTRLHSPTFVCDSSSFVYNSLVTRLCFWNRSFLSLEKRSWIC